MEIDDSAWPLVIATCPSVPKVESIDALERYFVTCFHRRESFAMITDTRPVHQLPDAKWRQRLAAWMNEPGFREKNGRYNVGAATIISSAPVRATLTAINWLWKPPSPQRYTRDMSESVDWCVGQLRAARVPLGPSLEAFVASLRRKSG